MAGAQLTCLCGAIKTTFSSPVSSTFPFPTTLCHCNPCRQTSGALYGEFPRLAEAPSADLLAACTRYDSLGSGGVRRYFCSRCGTHVFVHDSRDGQWHGLGGALEQDGGEPVSDQVKVVGHMFLDDTVDGGVVAAHPGLLKLRYGDDQAKELPCYAKWADENLVLSDVRRMAEAARTSATPKEGESLAAKCHCGGVDLRIKRASYGIDTQGVPDRVIPPEKDKYYASFCACRSCRLANGAASLQPWAIVPVANITIAASGDELVWGRSAMEDGANQGTLLKQYWTSKNVCWNFCGRCGATMLYWNEQGPTMADVAVGILRAPEGAFARNWLWWKDGQVSFSGEAVDEQIYKALAGEGGAA